MLLKRTRPVRARDVDGFDLQPVPLRIFDDGRGMVKTHRLVIEQRGGESGKIAAFQISAGIGQQGKARRVRFRETIKRKGGDRLHDLLLRLARDAVRFHAATQVLLHLFHPRFRTLESHRAAQIFRFTPGKSCGDHGHPQQLLLKEWYAQRSPEHRLKRRMRIRDRLATLPAP